MNQTTHTDRDRYAVAADALADFRTSGYLMYLNIEMDDKRDESGLSDDDKVLEEVIDEWQEEANPPGPDPDVSLLATWLDYKQYESYFPTVERDLTIHGKCLGCGSNQYKSGLGCSCPVGMADGTWYDCLKCGEEYADTSRTDDVPLCRSCFTQTLRAAQRAERR